MGDESKVICPNCVHEFFAVPESVQRDLMNLRAALHTQAEESAKLIEQRDGLLNACRRSVIAISAACEFRPEFLGDYKALSAAINKATNTTN